MFCFLSFLLYTFIYSPITVTKSLKQIFYKFSEYKSQRLTIIFQWVIDVIPLNIAKATDLWSFWLVAI